MKRMSSGFLPGSLTLASICPTVLGLNPQLSPKDKFCSVVRVSSSFPNMKDLVENSLSKFATGIEFSSHLICQYSLILINPISLKDCCIFVASELTSICNLSAPIERAVSTA